MPAISVIIPNWNRAELLVRAIRSALQQTLAPAQIVVCDDGSTDQSRLVVEQIADSRVIWLPGVRSGLPAIPRNRGIQASSGEWLAFLDNDDEWHPDKLKRQYEVAQASGLGAVCCNAVRMVPGRGECGNYLDRSSGTISFSRLLKENEVICSSAMVHRSLLSLAGGFPEKAELKSVVDYSVWLRVATGSPFAYLSDPLVIYRDFPAESLRQDDQDIWFQRRMVFHDFLQWAESAGVGSSCCSAVRRRLAFDKALSVKSMIYRTITGMRRTRQA